MPKILQRPMAKRVSCRDIFVVSSVLGIDPVTILNIPTPCTIQNLVGINVLNIQTIIYNDLTDIRAAHLSPPATDAQISLFPGMVAFLPLKQLPPAIGPRWVFDHFYTTS